MRRWRYPSKHDIHHECSGSVGIVTYEVVDGLSPAGEAASAVGHQALSLGCTNCMKIDVNPSF